MEANGGQACAFKVAAVGAGNAGFFDGGAEAAGEYEVEVVPGGASAEALFELSGALGLEMGESETTETDGSTPRLSLGFAEHPPFALDALGGAADGDDRALEIEVCPAEAQ